MRAVLVWLLRRSLSAGLRGVYLRGRLPAGAAVLAANHHSYFDGHLLWWLGRVAGRRLWLLVAKENLDAFPVLALEGALQANRLRKAIRQLRLGGWVAVFVEGVLRYPGELGPTKPGAGFLGRHAGVPVVPVALRVALRGWEHPEAFVWVGEPVGPEGDWAGALRHLLRTLDGLLAHTHPRELPPGFVPILAGRRSLDERIRSWAGRFR
ncbi:MAG: 1-acyl-sn-glycerol-3-phosphate acyltransferase [Armatimonadota bacterium]|nr:1-acyl-sn-glycerol-3-phosphate acyltransferase [Armatimonadota bacterium]MDW8155694.1 1-acyl-sn-glycerol-3-phosphate acyltransferase [Armatimonadota bacterium]